ncbi:MAG: dienelactone hydrolase family protein [Ilumatobacteraceae bacterium]
MQSQLDSGTPITIAEVEGSTRGLVIAPDIFGLRPLFTDMVERLAAEWGMTTIAVEPFPGRELGPEIEPRYAAVPTLDDANVLGDLVAAAELTGCSEVGLIGFCMGGMYCFKAASTGRFDRIASFYGMIRLPEPWRSPGQAEPLELVAADPGAVLAIIGDLDQYTPPDAVEALEATDVETLRFADAEHGFAHDSGRPSHRAEDAATAFDRSRAWLAG